MLAFYIEHLELNEQVWPFHKSSVKPTRDLWGCATGSNLTFKSLVVTELGFAGLLHRALRIKWASEKLLLQSSFGPLKKRFLLLWITPYVLNTDHKILHVTCFMRQILPKLPLVWEVFITRLVRLFNQHLGKIVSCKCNYVF